MDFESKAQGFPVISATLIAIAAVVLVLVIVLPAALVPRPVNCDAITFQRPGEFAPQAICHRISSPSMNDNITIWKLGSGQLFISAFGGPMKVYYGFPLSGVQETSAFLLGVFQNISDPSICRDLGVYRNPSFDCNRTVWNLTYPSAFFTNNAFAAVPWFIRNPSNCNSDLYSINGTLTVFDNQNLNFSLASIFPTIMCVGGTGAQYNIMGGGMLNMLNGTSQLLLSATKGGNQTALASTLVSDEKRDFFLLKKKIGFLLIICCFNSKHHLFHLRIVDFDNPSTIFPWKPDTVRHQRFPLCLHHFWPYHFCDRSTCRWILALVTKTCSGMHQHLGKTRHPHRRQVSGAERRSRSELLSNSFLWRRSNSSSKFFGTCFFVFLAYFLSFFFKRW